MLYCTVYHKIMCIFPLACIAIYPLFWYQLASCGDSDAEVSAFVEK